MIASTFLLPVPLKLDDSPTNSKNVAFTFTDYVLKAQDNLEITRVKSLTEKLSRRPSLLKFFEEAVRN